MNKGFTLIETIVAIFVIGVITTALFSIIPTLYETDRYAVQQTSAVDEARRGMKIMLRELREMRAGQDGSYMIESASDTEIVFYSDIDQDEKTERVRYFLGEISDNEQHLECVSYSDGGQCTVVFDDFSEGEITNAQLRIGSEGDLGASNEEIDIYLDGTYVGRLCNYSGECTDCVGYFQDIQNYDVDAYIQDRRLEVRLDASYRVNDFCDWKYSNHSFIGDLTLSWDQEIAGFDQKFQKGIIEPTDDLVPEYVLEEEEVSSLSHYVQNQIDTPSKKVFTYYDIEGNEITDPQDNLERISLIGIKLIINVNSERKPNDYYLESKVKIRALSLDDEE